MKKILIMLSIVIAILVGIRFSITKFGEISRAKMLKASAVPTVELGEVKKLEISDFIEIPGRVESQDEVNLVARIDGYLQKKYFQEGDYVKKGQLLFTIEQSEYLNKLNQAKANLESAKANYYKASRDYARGDELVKKDFISKSTYDGLKADKDAASAAVKSASAALAEAQRNYGYTQIKSPIDGKIGSLQIHEGNYVTVASGTLATITKVNPIYVKYSVDSKQFDKLREEAFIPDKNGSPIKVDVILSSGKIYPVQGVQDFSDNRISTATGTLDFRATFKNDDMTLIPGDFVKVKVYSNKIKDVLVIPQDYTLQDSRGKYVYVADENNTVQPKYFKDDGQYEGYWIVKEGISEGDKYIVSNLTKLMPKMPVKIADSTQTADEQQKETEKENK